MLIFAYQSFLIIIYTQQPTLNLVFYHYILFYHIMKNLTIVFYKFNKKDGALLRLTFTVFQPLLCQLSVHEQCVTIRSYFY